MNENRCCIKQCCFNIAISIVAALMTFAIGLVAGASFAEPLQTFLPSIVVFLIVMIILLIVLLIFRNCRRDREESCFDR
ncbi:MAG: hypothetical protein IJQ50_02720 [Clostridia bacterium]|nr:hypothetical protein [Clostridia bacterium]